MNKRDLDWAVASIVLEHEVTDENLHEVPKYSSSIEKAWELVEWMMKRGVCRISNGDGDSFDVGFFSFGWELFDHEKEYNAATITVYPDKRESFEESFATAICYAAITVVDKSAADAWKRWVRRGDDEVSGM
jgi:hypothetical protein